MGTVILLVLYAIAGFFGIVLGVVVASTAVSAAAVVVWIGLLPLWILAAPVTMLSGITRTVSIGEWMNPWGRGMRLVWDWLIWSLTSLTAMLFAIWLFLAALSAVDNNAGLKKAT